MLPMLTRVEDNLLSDITTVNYLYMKMSLAVAFVRHTNEHWHLSLLAKTNKPLNLYVSPSAVM